MLAVIVARRWRILTNLELRGLRSLEMGGMRCLKVRALRRLNVRTLGRLKLRKLRRRNVTPTPLKGRSHPVMMMIPGQFNMRKQSLATIPPVAHGPPGNLEVLLSVAAVGTAPCSRSA